MTERIVRRPGKELRDRLVATLLLVPTAPVLALCAGAIKLEGLLDRRARGPVFFAEHRVSRGEIFELLKFRTLTRDALAELGPGPTHIKPLEAAHTTRIGKLLKQWYLDELPQLINIARGDMLLIGTRPWPLDAYEAEVAQGITRKRDMPAGLIGPVQGAKGRGSKTDRELDAEYWHAYTTYPWWRLFALDLRIVWDSVRTVFQHKGL
jgi:lipopolysaccharide/colanic/teichoic acid biosynthesis glycosyltransferase